MSGNEIMQTSVGRSASVDTLKIDEDCPPIKQIRAFEGKSAWVGGSEIGSDPGEWSIPADAHVVGDL